MDAAGRAALLTRIGDAADTAIADDGVIYRSRGVALVVGDDGSVLAPARALAAKLRVVVFAPGIEHSTGLPRGLTAVGGRIAAVHGHLGQFRAYAAIPGGEHRDMAPFSPNADGCFDLVLDLGRTPTIGRTVGPPGYFAPRIAAGIDATVTAMAGMVGTFRKPRFFAFDADLCAHGAKGITGCTRCIDVCDAAAIRSTGNTITVDPFLCQGCATCTLACPTGALAFAPAPRSDLLESLASAFASAAAEGTAHPTLVVRTSPAKGPDAGASSARTIVVEALPAFGDELWLEALAAGAGAVHLVADATLAPRARQVLEERVAEVKAILAAIGADAESIALVDHDAAIASTSPPQSRLLSKPLATGKPFKRTVAQEAIDALTAEGDAPRAAALPPGSAYGTLAVDARKCTLCCACANLCPTSALRIGEGTGRTLDFVEAECVQCGLCAVGCPERAIELVPRVTSDRALRNTVRALAEDTMECCTACGTPFIGRKLLARSLEHLRDDPMLRDGGLERLHLCPDCRARATLSGLG